jgi:FkbM family methyltransferase
MRGLNAIRSLYRAVLPDGRSFRVDDFDGSLKLDVDLREGIGVNIWHNPNGYERLERELFCSAVTEGCTVLDIGANIGMYTLLAAKRGARVFAIEPDPFNAQLLRHHLELNGLSHVVTVFELAAAAEEQELTLHRNPANCGASSVYGDGEAFPVRAGPIDSLGLPPIDVCKLDIEGYEVVALSGMSETLRRSPNLRMLVECSSEHRDSSEMVSLLKREFIRVSIVGGSELVGAPPPFCNLWCTK